MPWNMIPVRPMPMFPLLPWADGLVWEEIAEGMIAGR